MRTVSTLVLVGLLLGFAAPARADDEVTPPPGWQPAPGTVPATPLEGRYVTRPARPDPMAPPPPGPRIVGAPPNDEVASRVRIGERRALLRWCTLGCDPYATARGPLEIRDPWLLVQPRLTLPAETPDVLACGRWRIRGGLEWGNDFGFSQTGEPEGPQKDRHFFVDGEHLTLDLQARRGLGRCLEVGVRVPLLWRGGGILDGLIEWIHRQFNTLNNSRDQFYLDMYRVQGRDAAVNRFEWEDHGWGLGRVELDAKWQFVRPRCRSDWRVAGIVRVALPTCTGPYRGSGGVDSGVQVVAARQLHRRWEMYASLGGTWYSDTDIEGFEYEPIRGYGSFAVEYRVLPYLSLLLQTDASSRLIANLVDYPDYQWYGHFGMKADLGGGWRLTVGFTENIADQQSTTDFSWWAGLEVEL